MYLVVVMVEKMVVLLVWMLVVNSVVYWVVKKE